MTTLEKVVSSGSNPKLEAPDRKIVRSDFTYNLLYYFITSMKPLYKVSSENGSAIPKEGPAMLLSEHSQWRDIPAIAYVAKHESGRFLNFFAKSEYYKQYNGLGTKGFNLLTDPLLKLTGAHPVDRTTLISPLNRATIRHLEDLLVNQGEVGVIHPRGTRKQGGDLKRGIIYFVLRILEEHPEMQIPVLPVYITHLKRRPLMALNSHVSIGDNIYSPGMDCNELIQRTSEEFQRMKSQSLYVR